MARFARLDVYSQILATGLVPVFHHPDLEVAKHIVEACRAGGAMVVEYTNRGDNAYRVFSDLVTNFAAVSDDLVLGVGSVVDGTTAALYVASGANFVVGPTFSEEVARLCNRHKVVYIPGCATPTEISQAEAWGAEIVKVFPPSALGGPDFIRAVHRPTPWTRMMPTGIEATRQAIEDWFSAGADAVGVGSHLVKPEWVLAEDWDSIAALTSDLLGWIQGMRRRKANESQ